MACRSCRSGLGLVTAESSFLSHASRRSLSSSSSSSRTAIAASQSRASRPAPSPARPSQQARRSLHGTRQCWQEEAGAAEDGSKKQKKEGGFSLRKMVADKLVSVAGNTAKPYLAFGATQRMVKACASQADYTITRDERRNGLLKLTDDGEEIGTGGGMWHDDFHLLPTFSTWAHVTMLHMYLLVVRMRCMDPEAHELWQGQLVDHFFHQAEDKMDNVHDLGSRMVRQKYLRDLFVQWRGVLMAYDEGLVKGDAVLAAAVWRNLFKARDDVDLRVLAAIVSWMRSCLKNLDQMQDFAFPLQAESVFKWPARSELVLVDLPARGLEGVYSPDPAGVAAAAAAAAAAGTVKS